MRGLLAFWLLWELRLGPLNGQQLGERLAWRRGDAISPGTLYPALAALEEAGSVSKARDGRESVYRLTAPGARDLACAQAYLRLMFRDVLAGAPLQLTRRLRRPA